MKVSGAAQQSIQIEQKSSQTLSPNNAIHTPSSTEDDSLTTSPSDIVATKAGISSRAADLLGVTGKNARKEFSHTSNSLDLKNKTFSVIKPTKDEQVLTALYNKFKKTLHPPFSDPNQQVQLTREEEKGLLRETMKAFGNLTPSALGENAVNDIGKLYEESTGTKLDPSLSIRDVFSQIGNSNLTKLKENNAGLYYGLLGAGVGLLGSERTEKLIGKDGLNVMLGNKTGAHVTLDPDFGPGLRDLTVGFDANVPVVFDKKGGNTYSRLDLNATGTIIPNQQLDSVGGVFRAGDEDTDIAVSASHQFQANSTTLQAGVTQQIDKLTQVEAEIRHTFQSNTTKIQGQITRSFEGHTEGDVSLKAAYTAAPGQDEFEASVNANLKFD